MVRICKHCGNTLDMKATHCMECGNPVVDYDEIRDSELSGEETGLINPNMIPGEDNIDEEQSRKSFSAKGTKYEPISTAGYLGIILLLAIPVIGLIFAVRWAMGGCRKVQKKFFARAALIIMTFNMILGIVTLVTVKTVMDNVLEEVGMEWSDIASLYDILYMADTLSAYEDEYYDDEYYEDEYYDDEYYYDEYDEETESYGLLGRLAALAESHGLTLEEMANMESLDEVMNYLGYGDYSEVTPESESSVQPETSSVPDSSSSTSSVPSSSTATSENVPQSSAVTGTTQQSSQSAEGQTQGSSEAEYDDYEESDGIWPRNIREYTHGIKTDISPNYLEISNTNRTEMGKYVDQLKKDGYKYLDFYEYDMTEKEMLEIDEWCGTNGKIFINVYNYDDIVIIEYMEEAP